MDLNGTRIAAQHSLLFSEMRLNRLLKTYVMSNPEAISDPPLRRRMAKYVGDRRGPQYYEVVYFVDAI